jgi:hypothetical protein
MNLITGTQIKLARTVLSWRNADLAEHSNIGTTTIKKLEQSGDEIPSARIDTVLKIKETLEPKLKALGWYFTDSGGIDKFSELSN